MSEKIREVFANHAQKHTTVFVAYLMAGYPNPDDIVPTMLALQEGGANIIELGVPFSDPIADGYIFFSSYSILFLVSVLYLYVPFLSH